MNELFGVGKRQGEGLVQSICRSLPVPGADVALWVEEALGLKPDPVQAVVLNSRARRGILNCSRQWGKSTVAAAKVVHLALSKPKSEILIVSPSLRQSALLLEKAASMFARLGVKVKRDPHHRVSLVLSNGSRIIGLPCRASNIRGFSAPDLILLDEAAFKSDEVYEAVRPMLATCDGALWLLSTPNGQRGFFHKIWTSSEEEWERIRVTGEECPRISKEHLAAEREELGEALYAQEYGCEFLRRFDDAWDMEKVRGRVNPLLEPLVLPGQRS